MEFPPQPVVPASTPPPRLEEYGQRSSAESLIFSLCVPTFERARSLERLIAQLVPLLERSKFRHRVEVVFSDNASTDDTAEVLRSGAPAIGAICPVRVYTQLVNMGGEANFKFLYEHARGHYTCIWGDDDEFCDGQFDALLRDLEQYQPEVCVSSFANFALVRKHSTGSGTDNHEQPHVETELPAIVEQIYALGKISQYVFRHHELTPAEQRVSDRAARETYFWFPALALKLLLDREHTLLRRAPDIGRSDKGSWDMRFSPRVYASKRTAMLIALEGHPLHARFAESLSVEPVENYVVGNLLRTSIGLSRMTPEVAADEYRYLKKNLRQISFSNLRNFVKVPVILLLYPIVSRIRYRQRGTR